MSETGGNAAAGGIGADWDVIVIGSGIGGATMASQLLAQGCRVLMLERGRRISTAGNGPQPEKPEERMAAGWWPNAITLKSPGSAAVRFHAPVGCAVGGSSL